MILLAIAITILCIGSVSAVEETNSTLETVNEISQNENIVINEMTDETVTDDDSKGGNIVGDSNDKQNIENKEILKASGEEDVLSAENIVIQDSSGASDGIISVNYPNTVNFEFVSYSGGTSIPWYASGSNKVNIYVIDGDDESLYSTTTLSLFISNGASFTPSKEGTYEIYIECESSFGSDYSQNLIYKFMQSGSSTPKATQVDITVPSTGILDNSFNIPYTVTTTGGKAVNEGTLTFYDQNGQIGSPIALTSSSGTFTHTYTTENTYNIYAKYTGNDNYEDSQSSTNSIIISADDNSDEADITLNIVQSNSDYLYPFTGEQAWISVLNTQRSTDKQYKVKFDVKFKNNAKSSPKFEYSADGLNWKELSLFDETDLVIGFSTGFDRGWITGWNMIYGVSDKSSYSIRVSDNGKTSNVVTIKCLQGTSSINEFDFTPESGDEGTTIDFKFKPILSNGYPFTEGYVSFFSDESRDASSLLGTLTASSSSEFSNQYLTGQITLPLVDATGEYTIYYAFVGKTANGGYNDLDSFTLTIKDVAAVDKDTTISLTPTSYTIIQGESQIITPSLIDSDSQSVNVGTITYYDGDNPISGYTDVGISTAFDTSTLSAGTHTIKAKYNGGDGYNPSELSNPVTVIVNQPAGFTISISDVVYPNVPQAIVSVSQAGTYTITIGSKTYTKTFDGAGSDTITLDKFAAKDELYAASITYNGKVNTTTFKVDKGTPVLDVAVKGNETLVGDVKNITVTADVGGGKIILNNDESVQYDIGQVIDLSGLSQTSTINVKYVGNENYTSVNKDVKIVVFDSYPTEITLTLNTSVISKGNTIKITPDVKDSKNNKLEKGIVKFYDGETEIGQIDLSEKTYLEYTPDKEKGLYEITAKYVENTTYKYAESTSDSQSYKIKGKVTITIERVNDDLIVKNSEYSGPTVEFTITYSEDISENIALMNGQTRLFGEDGSSSTSINYRQYSVGLNDIYVKFEGDDDFDAAESNHIDLAVYQTKQVTVSLDSDVSFVVEGDKVTFTTGATYYSNGYQNAPGKVKIYADYKLTELIGEADVGDDLKYSIPVSSNADSSYRQTFYAAYDDVVDDGEYTIYTLSRQGSKSITILTPNTAALTANGQNSVVEVKSGDKITLHVDVDKWTYSREYDYSAGDVYKTNVEMFIKTPGSDSFESLGQFAYSSGIKDAELTLDGEGEYVIYAYYKGLNASSQYDSSYAPVKSNEITITVKPAFKETTIELSADKNPAKYGDDVVITPTVKSGDEEITTGTITFYIDSVENKTINVGETFTLSNVNVTTYNITAKYNKNEEYLDSSYELDLTVNKAENHIKVSVVDVDYPTEANIIVEADVDGTYTVKVGNTNVDIEVKQGRGNKTVLLTPDKYDANITYVNDNYEGIVENTSFTVNKGTNNIKVIVDRVNTLPGDVLIRVEADVEGTYTVKITDSQSVDVVANGEGTSVSLKAGDYKANVTWTDSNYNAVIANATFKVVKSQNNVLIETDGSTYPDAVTVKVTADIKGTYTVKITDTISRDVTIENDGESKEFTVNLPANDYSASIINYESDDYDLITQPVDFRVNKGKNNIVITAESVEYPNTVTVKVTDDLGETYTVKITDDISLTVKANTEGKTVSLPAGKYTATTSWENDNYDAEITSANFEVKKATNNVEIIVENTYLPNDVKVTVNADVSGTYTVQFNNSESISVVIADGEKSGSATYHMQAGKYQANTTFANTNYNVNIKNATFDVLKSDVSVIIKIDNNPTIFGSDVTGTVIANVSGNYIVKVGELQPITVAVDGTGTFNLGKLTVDNYRVYVEFKETPDYNVNSNSTDFEVTQTGTEFDAYSGKTEYTYGEEIKLIHTLPDGATGNVKYTYANGDEIGEIGVLDEKSLGVLDANTYTVIAEYSGDTNYKKAQKTLSFKVNPAENKITVTVDTAAYPDEITVNVEADVPDVYIVKIGSQTVTVNVTDKKASNKTKLNAGTYTTEVQYSNNNYNGIITEDTFEVAKGTNTIVVSVDEVSYGSPSTVTVVADVDGVYNVDVNGEIISVTVDRGIGSGSVSLDAGIGYQANVSWTDSNYDAVITNATFNVLKADNNVVLVSDGATYPNNVSIKVTADVKGTYTVKITDSVSETVTIDENGGSKVITVKLDADEYTASVIDPEMPNYNLITTPITFQTKKGTNNVVVSVDEVSYGSPSTVTVVADVDGIYAVNVNGELIYVTVGDGTGSQTVSLDAGIGYQANASWSNPNYDVSITNATFNVLKADNNVVLVSDGATYPDGVSIKVTADVKGTYTVKITDSVSETVTIDENGGSKTITVKLDAGKYTASVVDLEMANYNLVSQNINFEVKKGINHIKVTVEDTTLPNKVTVNVKADVDGIYTVKLNDEIITVEVKSGEYSNTVDLQAGKYTTDVIFENANYENAVENANFEVFEKPLTANLTIRDRNYPDEENNVEITTENNYALNLDYYLDKPDAEIASENIAFYYNGEKQFESGTVINGKSTVIASSMLSGSGTFTVKAVYTATLTNGTVFTKESNELTIDVEINNPSDIFKIRDYNYQNNSTITIIREDSVTIIVQYYIESNDIWVSEEKVVFDVGGRTNEITNVKHNEWAGFQFTLSEDVDFTIRAVYSGSSIFNGGYFEEQSNVLRYHIESKSDNVTVEVEDADYGTHATAKINASADGQYIITVNGKEYPVEVTGGKGSVQIDIIAADKYDATVVSKDNADLKNNTTFKVRQISPNLNIKASENEINYGTLITLTYEINSKTEGNVKIFKDGVEITEFEDLLLDVGTYTFEAKYDGDKNFTEDSAEVTVQVNAALNNIEVSVESETYPNKVTINVKADVDGIYTVDINGTKVNVTVSGKQGSNTTLINAGNYSAKVIYSDKNYEAIIKNDTFQVAQGETELKVIVPETNYGKEIIGTVIANQPGTYYVSIPGITPIEVIISESGSNTFTLGNELEVNRYTVTVEFNGNGNYKANRNQSEFNVTQSGTEFNADTQKAEYTYGENIILIHELPADAEGKVTYTYINGTPIGESDVGDTLNISKLNAGTYTIIAKYSGDTNYKETTDNIQFEVKKALNNVVVEVAGVTYPGVVTVRVSADVDGVYTVDVNGNGVSVEVIGKSGENTVKLDAGNYSANATFSNNNYISKITNDTFEVKKALNNVVVEVAGVTYPGVVTVRVSADVDGVYTVDVGGIEVSVEVIGKSGENTVKLDAGTYSANTTFDDKNYDVSIKNTTFTVNKGINNIKVSADDTTLPDKVVVNVTGDVKGTYTLKIGDKSQNVEIISGGATAQVVFDLAEGTYTPEIIYSDKNYDAVVSTNQFTVNPRPISGNLVIRDGKNPNSKEITLESGETFLFEYNLTRSDADYATERLIIYCNGQEYYSYSNPVTGEFANIGGNIILNDKNEYEFKAVWEGNTTDGKTFTAESNIIRFNVIERSSDIIKIRDSVENQNREITLTTYDNVTFIIEYYLQKPESSFGFISESVEILCNGQHAITVENPKNKEYTGVLTVTVNQTMNLVFTAVYKAWAFMGSQYEETSSSLTYHIIVNEKANTLTVSAEDVDYGTKANITVNSSVDGEYIVFADKEYSLTVTNGSGWVLTDILPAGKYDISVTSKENSSFTNQSDFTVNQIAPGLTIDATSKELTYGETTTISSTIDPRATGNVKFFEGDVELANVENIKLSAGTHIITVKYDGDRNFTGDSKEIAIKVSKASNNIKLNISDVDYPQNITINITADVDGDYNVVIGSDNYIITVTNGSGVKSVKLNPGKYDASVEFKNDNYSDAIDADSFTVHGTTIGLKGDATPETVVLDNTITLNTSSDVQNTPGKVIFKFDDGTSVESAIGVLVTYKPLTPGEHKITVTYAGDDVYDPETTTITVNVAKKQNNIKVEVTNANYPDNVTVTVTADVDGTYAIDINKTTYYVNVIGKTGSLSIKKDAGSYYANITYENDTYDGITANTTFTVNKGVNNIKVSADDTTLPDKVVVNVTGDVKGTYTVKIGDKSQNVEITSDGATAQVVFDLAEGTYTPEIIYSDKNYDAKITVNQFTVNPRPVSANLVIRDGKNPNDSIITVEKGYGFLFEYNLTRSDAEYATERIIIYCNGQEYYSYNNPVTGEFTNIGGNLGLTAADEFEFKAIWEGNTTDGETYTAESNTIKFNVIEASSSIIKLRDADNGENLEITLTGNDSITFTLGYYLTKPEGSIFGFEYESIEILQNGEHYANVVAGSSNGFIRLAQFTANATVDVTFKLIYKAKLNMFATTYEEHSNDLTYHIIINEIKQNVTIEMTNVTYGEKSNITVKSNTDDNFTVVIGNEKFDIEVKNGTASRLISLAAGNYTATVTSKTNSSVVNSTGGEVKKATPELTISADNTIVRDGTAVILTHTITDGATGIVSIYDNGEFLANVTVGNALENIILTSGTHKITAKYNSNENYTEASDEITITVSEKENNVNMSITSPTYPENATITVTADIDGTYTVDIGGNKVNIEVKDGKGNATVSLPAGDYVAKLTTSDKSIAENFTVSKAKNNIKITVNEVRYPQNATVTVTADVDGTYTVIINETSVDVEVINGSGNASIGLAPGLYGANVTYANPNYETIVQNTTFTISKGKNNIKIIVNDTVLPNKTVVEIESDVDGTYTVDINGIDVVIKVENGKGNGSVTLTPGKYEAKLINSDDNYDVNVETAKFNVTAAPLNANITIRDANLTGNSTITIESDGNVSIYLEYYLTKPDGDLITSSIEITANGKHIITIDDPESDKFTPVGVIAVNETAELKFSAIYTAWVFMGDRYTQTSNEITYTVKIENKTEEIKAVLTVGIDNVVYGNETTITVKSNLNETFEVQIGDDVIEISVINGSGSKSVKFNAGNYTATVISKTNTSLKNNTEFEVSKATSKITVSANSTNITTGEAIKLNYVLNVNSTAEVKFFDGETEITDINNVVLSKGTHIITAKFAGDDNYIKSQDSITITVTDMKNNISVNVTSPTYPENATITVAADVDGTYTVDINGSKVNIVVKDGKGNVTVSLPAGDYVANLTSDGNEITCSFSINKAPNNIKVSADDVTLPENATITVVADVDGTYTVDINGTVLTVKVENNKGSLSLALPEGSYNVNVTFNNPNYISIIENDTFTVKGCEIVNNISMEVTSPTYPENATITVAANVDGTYTVDINGSKVDIVVKDGSGTASINLPAGDYTAKLENITANFTVNPKEKNSDYELNATAENTTVGNTKLIIQTPEDATGNIAVTVNNNTFTAPVENGKAIIDLSGLDKGSYIANISYSGDDKYSSKDISQEFNITKKAIGTVIVVDSRFSRVATDYYAGERGGIFYATLMDTEGNLLANKKVQIAVNGPIYNVTTDNQGRIPLQINLAAANTYTYALFFQGDDTYNASHIASSKLTVTKKSTAISASNKAFKVKTKTKTVSVTLKTIKNKYDGKTYLKAGKKITLKVNGKTYTAKTNSKGVAKFKVKLTKKGKYAAAIKFAGDKTYKASSKSIKITVK